MCVYKEVYNCECIINSIIAIVVYVLCYILHLYGDLNYWPKKGPVLESD